MRRRKGRGGEGRRATRSSGNPVPCSWARWARRRGAECRTDKPSEADTSVWSAFPVLGMPGQNAERPSSGTASNRAGPREQIPVCGARQPQPTCTRVCVPVGARRAGVPSERRSQYLQQASGVLYPPRPPATIRSDACPHRPRFSAGSADAHSRGENRPVREGRGDLLRHADGERRHGCRHTWNG